MHLDFDFLDRNQKCSERNCGETYRCCRLRLTASFRSDPLLSQSGRVQAKSRRSHGARDFAVSGMQTPAARLIDGSRQVCVDLEHWIFAQPRPASPKFRGEGIVADQNEQIEGGYVRFAS